MAREELVKVPAVILGSRLRAKRKTLHFSQHQLGGDEFSPSYVSAVERGKIRPSLKALYILADRLGEPVTYFLETDQSDLSIDHLDDVIVEASIMIDSGMPQEAVSLLQTLALDGHAPNTQARVHLGLGQAYLAQHQSSAAISHLLDALAQAQLAGDHRLEAAIRLEIGSGYFQQRKIGLALDYHRQCLDATLDGKCGDVGYELRVYDALASDLVALGQEKEAMTYLDGAMRLADKAASVQKVAQAFWSSRAGCAAASDAVQARMLSRRSAAAFEIQQVLKSAATLRNTFGSVLSSLGQFDAAGKAFGQAMASSERIDEPGIHSLATIHLGEISAQKADYAAAADMIKRGIAEAESHGNNSIAGKGLLSLAQVLAAEGKHAAADDEFQAAITRLEQTGADDDLGRAYFRYGQTLADWGQNAKASTYLEKAYLQTHKA